MNFQPTESLSGSLWGFPTTTTGTPRVSKDSLDPTLLGEGLHQDLNPVWSPGAEEAGCPLMSGTCKKRPSVETQSALLGLLEAQ